MSTPLFLFENSFSGYSFSFALIYNNNDAPYLNNTASSVSNDAILNIPVSSEDTTCFPFGYQFVLQPFGNSEAAYATNSQSAFASESALTAKALSQFFAAAFTPATYQFNYDSDGTPSVKICYDYKCNNRIDDTTTNSCTQFLEPVVFEYTGENKKSLAKSTIQDMYVPCWTDAQLSDTTTSAGCYPSVVKIRLRLEADAGLQKIFPRLLTYAQQYPKKPVESVTVGGASGNQFPVFYLRVVVDDSALLPKDALGNFVRRAFFTSEIQKDGIPLTVLSQYTPTQLVSSTQGAVVIQATATFSTIVSQVQDQNTDTNTIGVLVFSELAYTTSPFTIFTKKPQNVNLGTFPTEAGAVAIADENNRIRNGDVVFVEALASVVGDVDDGNFMTFQYREVTDAKVPTMAKAPVPNNNFLWQVLALNSAGFIQKTNVEVTFDSNIALYAYECKDNDPTKKVACGYLSATNGGGTNNTPSMFPGALPGTCETWTLKNKTGTKEKYISTDGTYFGLEVNNNNSCAFPGGCLTNGTRPGRRPPAIFQKGNCDGTASLWRFAKVASAPLPS